MFIDFSGGAGEERNIDVRNIDWVPPVIAPKGGQTHNPGMCPGRELNPQSFGVQFNTPTN